MKQDYPYVTNVASFFYDMFFFMCAAALSWPGPWCAKETCLTGILLQQKQCNMFTLFQISYIYSETYYSMNMDFKIKLLTHVSYSDCVRSYITKESPESCSYMAPTRFNAQLLISSCFATAKVPSYAPKYEISYSYLYLCYYVLTYSIITSVLMQVLIRKALHQYQ